MLQEGYAAMPFLVKIIFDSPVAISIKLADGDIIEQSCRDAYYLGFDQTMKKHKISIDIGNKCYTGLVSHPDLDNYYASF